MEYIQGTVGLPLILLMNKSGNIKFYVDAAFTVHNYMGSHTGGFMTMVTDGSYDKFIKKKSTNISTEAKLFGVKNILA